jgi:hypothetical protein
MPRHTSRFEGLVQERAYLQTKTTRTKPEEARLALIDFADKVMPLDKVTILVGLRWYPKKRGIIGDAVADVGKAFLSGAIGLPAPFLVGGRDDGSHVGFIALTETSFHFCDITSGKPKDVWGINIRNVIRNVREGFPLTQPYISASAEEVSKEETILTYGESSFAAPNDLGEGNAEAAIEVVKIIDANKAELPLHPPWERWVVPGCFVAIVVVIALVFLYWDAVVRWALYGM